MNAAFGNEHCVGFQVVQLAGDVTQWTRETGDSELAVQTFAPHRAPVRSIRTRSRSSPRDTAATISVAASRLFRSSSRATFDHGAHHRTFGSASAAFLRLREGRVHSPPSVGPPTVQPAALSVVPGSSS